MNYYAQRLQIGVHGISILAMNAACQPAMQNATAAWRRRPGLIMSAFPPAISTPSPPSKAQKAAASAYAKTLSKVELFDFVISGAGRRWPHRQPVSQSQLGRLADSPSTLAVHDAPKPPSERVSLSAPRLSRTRQLMFLVSGSSKRQAIMDWRLGKQIPAAAISPTVVWMCIWKRNCWNQ